MANYGHIIFYSLVGGVFSLVGGILLLSKKSWADALARYATPFSAGALLAAVFLDLLTEGVQRANAYSVMMATMVGMILFFMAERFLRWFHHHHRDDGSDTIDHSDDNVSLIIIGDTVHNALDGIAIAASFLVSVPTGIITTIAVAAHEIPQEIGDFGLLLSKGLSRKKVLFFNVVSALATLVFAVITFWLGTDKQLPVGILFGLSAGFLLYIAASDIIPTLHDETPHDKLLDIRPILLIVGAVTVGLAIHFAHSIIEPDTHTPQTSDHSSTESHDE
ncbi:ZIP family metal transporter [Candidatus Saccharibacteria bacterium]|jgi:zinc and cadmium transporter|nr:ZIP family metal transporter [Candidatus Saccharibacteria bacterium]